MPISNNKKLVKTRPHIIRNIKKNVVHNSKKSNDKSVNIFNKLNVIWHDDKPVYIIGGGPSLKGFDWNKLKDKRVIAINKAFKVLPYADVLYWTDTRFFTWFKDEINNFKGMKVTCRKIPNKPKDVILLKPVNSTKIDMRTTHLAHGNNSGFAAINLAVKLGAKKIYLLGFDMNSSKIATHWHEGYKIKHNHGIYDKMIKNIITLSEELKNHNIKVYNANPNSKLTCFKKCKLEDAVNNIMP